VALAPDEGSLVFVENVGNLVCPALFDVGEHAKAVVVSVTEGDDKPIKYPHLFATADGVVVYKSPSVALGAGGRNPSRVRPPALDPAHLPHVFP
jgi:hydrogenase accessory protein HypB